MTHRSRDRRAAPARSARLDATLGEAVRLLRAGDGARAVATFAAAVAMAPREPLPLVQLGMAQQQTGDAEAARGNFRRALDLAPDFEPTLVVLAKAMRHGCDWEGLAEVETALDRATAHALAAGRCPLEGPFLNMLRKDDPEENRILAEAWAGDYARGVTPLPPVRPATGRRPRIGYLCGQWYSHPVMQCMSFVMAAHDRDRFEVIGLDYGPARDDPFRRRALAAVDRHVRLSLGQPRAAAEAIRAAGIDVLVDLTGHTEQAPLRVLAHRPAPAQLSYLGFVGSSGAAYMDGLITDRVLAPPACADHYSEPLLHLPESFIAMGPAPEVEQVPTTRTAQGLPEDALVLASFNGPQKLDPRHFELWLDILEACPKAVLWQLADESIGGRLRRRASARGLSPERLILAGKVNYYHHLARIRLADLALDTYPYGGGVTSLNLLWAGVPIVSRAGRHAGSRMTASLLTAAGLDELVVTTFEAYRDTALALTADPVRHADLRARLEAHVAASDLLRPIRLAKALEAIYGETLVAI